MLLTINIEDRAYKDMEAYCAANNLKVEDYVVQIVNEKHLLNKYGDLNEVLDKAVEQSSVTPKKRAVRAKKTKEEGVAETSTEKQATEEVKVEEKLPQKPTNEAEKPKNEAEKKPIKKETAQPAEDRWIEPTVEMEGVTKSTPPKPTLKRKRTLKKV